MSRPFTLIALVIALFVALSPLSALAAPAEQAASPLVLPVTGTVPDLVGGAGTFAGTFTLESFRLVNGQLSAVGTLTGTLADSLGNTIGTVTQQVTIPVTAISGTCDILHLVLGPLDLNLLGLMVHLDRVVLDITAQAAPGNLLGNLLCVVAHLLDQGGPVAGLVNQLNHILRVLG